MQRDRMGLLTWIASLLIWSEFRYFSISISIRSGFASPMVISCLSNFWALNTFSIYTTNNLSTHKLITKHQIQAVKEKKDKAWKRSTLQSHTLWISSLTAKPLPPPIISTEGRDLPSGTSIWIFRLSSAPSQYSFLTSSLFSGGASTFASPCS